MSAQIRRDALWDSFCHWVDNWHSALFTKEKKVGTNPGDCACCGKWFAPDELGSCPDCPLDDYGLYCCTTNSPYSIACGLARGKRIVGKSYVCVTNSCKIRFAKAAEHMALVLYLLYVVEGGRK